MFEKLKGSKLARRFFFIFLAYSFVMIALTLIIAAGVIFSKDPPPHPRDRRPPPHHDMEEGHHPPPHHLDRPHHKGHPRKMPRFFNDLGATLSILTVFMVILSFFIATYLSRSFVLPISKLAAAAKKLSKHDFSTRISEDRSDEIGMLAHDFNQMADKLEKYESLRKQWIADIAHELRTPISIMQGEVEAVQDSVWPMNMDMINHFHSEIKYLAKTVNDLHALSIAESEGLILNMEKTCIGSIVTDAVTRFRERLKTAGIKLEIEPCSDKSLLAMADPHLLRTVLNNLIENSIRYTDSPGTLKVSCFKEKTDIVVILDDSYPGVPKEYQDRIFDRLFRVDSSRSRKHGGSGLGLSTSKVHIEAMDGMITAEDSPLEGVRITIRIPAISGERS